jgi:hypothetical protein
MRLAPLFVVAGWIAAITPAAHALDYARIDRTLSREPEYRSGAPQYALLLFGPRAEFHVWAVLDGETLYLDRNQDGDLIAADERIGPLKDCKDVSIGDGRDPAPCVIASASTFEEDQAGAKRRFLLIFVQIPGAYRQYAGVALQDSPQRAHLAHFHGPLKIYPGSNDGRPGPEHVLRVGEAVELDAVIGTIVPEYGCWTAVEVERNHEPVFPRGVFPVIEVEFPAREPRQPPIRKTYPLSGFC